MLGFYGDLHGDEADSGAGWAATAGPTDWFTVF